LIFINLQIIVFSSGKFEQSSLYKGKKREWAWSEKPFGVVTDTNGHVVAEIYGLAPCQYASERTVKYVMARLLIRNLFISAPIAIMREIQQRYFKRKSPDLDDFLDSCIT